MTTVNSKRELDAAVAVHVMGHVVTPRRDVFMSGGDGPIIGYVEARPDGGAWNLSRYSDNPAASYALRQKMRADGWDFRLTSDISGMWCSWVHRDGQCETVNYPSECVVVALATLRALNVEFVLAENWDKN